MGRASKKAIQEQLSSRLSPLLRPIFTPILQEASRYYQADEDEQIRNAKECANCGERGHDKRDCEHLLVSNTSSSLMRRLWWQGIPLRISEQ